MNIDKLKKLMDSLSVEEKIGQLFQVAGSTLDENAIVTGNVDDTPILDEDFKAIGSLLSVSGAERVKQLQDKCMEKQPHHIPALFMFDIINGYHTIFPTPLAQGATFEPELSKKLASFAAREGAAAGMHVTFSPMVDLVRDARWGRVMESTGEDPYLNSLFGAAMVNGYQGNDVKEKGKLAACVKHFAAYGAPDGGRDYDNVELSETTLWNEYFPAYEAAIEAGAKMAMTSFNTLNGLPSSANEWLLKDVLRDQMKFDGVVISDYEAVKELVSHGVAEDEKEAAELALKAGLDIEMVSKCYIHHMKELIAEGKISTELLDESVWRVLKLKNELGLFENPYKDADSDEEKRVLLCEEHRAAAREAAVKSFVLLKNEDNILPLNSSKTQKIAFIGPYADNDKIHGSWSFPPKNAGIVTVKEGVERAFAECGAESLFEFYEGCCMTDEDWWKKTEKIPYNEEENEALTQEAVKAAENADVVVMCLGEHFQQSGEAASRAKLQLPRPQQELLRRVSAVNKNIVTLVFTGRPLELCEIEKLSKAVMIMWFPGTEGGNAAADVLFGEKEPGGRLTMSFPYSVAQMPLYYNHYRTGRLYQKEGTYDFLKGYIDESCLPLHSFGAGMGYTSFSYGEVKLDVNKSAPGDTITASCTVSNTGERAGTETVQMYISDLSASIVRPERQLKGFLKVTLKPHESKRVTFEIKEEMLRFWNRKMQYVSESGKFKVFIGHDSETDNCAEFTEIKDKSSGDISFSI